MIFDIFEFSVEPEDNGSHDVTFYNVTFIKDFGPYRVGDYLPWLSVNFIIGLMHGPDYITIELGLVVRDPL